MNTHAVNTACSVLRYATALRVTALPFMALECYRDGEHRAFEGSILQKDRTGNRAVKKITLGRGERRAGSTGASICTIII
jgi:hypothetical protein